MIAKTVDYLRRRLFLGVTCLICTSGFSFFGRKLMPERFLVMDANKTTSFFR